MYAYVWVLFENWGLGWVLVLSLLGFGVPSFFYCCCVLFWVFWTGVFGSGFVFFKLETLMSVNSKPSEQQKKLNTHKILYWHPLTNKSRYSFV